MGTIVGRSEQKFCSSEQVLPFKQGEATMSNQPTNETTSATDTPGNHLDDAGRTSSRRQVLQSGAGFVTGGAAMQVSATSTVFAQSAGAADGELARLQTRRRLLINGGIVLTLDRRVGDFAQADVLIEDGKIREVRPDIAVSA